MSRGLLIFGNGLGMAVDQEYFQLSVGIKRVWESTGQLTQEQKELIKRALPNKDVAECPSGEPDLKLIHLALIAVNIFNKLDLESWLDADAAKLPAAYRCFAHEVGFYFHQSEKKLEPDFATPLCEYLKATNSHVATLNYDNLLYDCLNRNNVFDGFKYLGDGYLRDRDTEKLEFSPKNLDSRRNRLGWYLHLHGSPLMVGNEKLTKSERFKKKASDQVHIVLTHADKKRDVIDESHVLKEYWSRLESAIEQSSFVSLFGCSGLDFHLNEVIRNHVGQKPVQVIEWNGDGESDLGRAKFWQDQLGKSVELERMSNILEFKDWGKFA